MEHDAFLDQLARRVVATPGMEDTEIDQAVYHVLVLVREVLHMDVAFVSRFERGQRVFRVVDQNDIGQVISNGESDALERSFCKWVVEGRLPELIHDVRKLHDFANLPPTPFEIGAHLSTPIVLADGSIYGTFCCFSFESDDTLTERDLKRLKMAAEMVARLIDAAEHRT